jgi:DNA-binding NtrC family response regulator
MQTERTVQTRKAESTIDIAVLDDDVDFVHYIEDFLKEERLYRVRTFTHPVDLLASCDQRKPDIVLLDMKMGPFKGEEVIQQLQDRYRDICIIVVTGYPSLEDMRATFRRKVFDYLAKPFSLSQLRQTLKNAVETHDLGRSPQARLRDRLGHRLKMLRVERDWSLKDLAGSTGVSVSQLSSIERGTHLPSMESLMALCQAFEIRPSELLASIGF